MFRSQRPQEEPGKPIAGEVRKFQRLLVDQQVLPSDEEASKNVPLNVLYNIKLGKLLWETL